MIKLKTTYPKLASILLLITGALITPFETANSALYKESGMPQRLAHHRPDVTGP